MMPSYNKIEMQQTNFCLAAHLMDDPYVGLREYPFGQPDLPPVGLSSTGSERIHEPIALRPTVTQVCLGELGAFHQDVAVMLPRVPDAAVNLHGIPYHSTCA